MATHSSTLAWRIPWTEEPGGLQSVGWHKVGYDWVTEHISVPVLYWPVYISSQNSGRVYRGLWIKSNAHKKKAWPLLSEAKVEGARARKITHEHMKMRLAPYSPTRDVFADRPSQVHPASTSRIKRLENIQEAVSLQRKVKHTRYLYQGLNPILSVVTPFLSLPVAAFTWNFIPLRARPLLCHLRRLTDSSILSDFSQALRWNSSCFGQVPIDWEANSVQLIPPERPWGAWDGQGLPCSRPLPPAFEQAGKTPSWNRAFAQFAKLSSASPAPLSCFPSAWCGQHSQVSEATWFHRLDTQEDDRTALVWQHTVPTASLL